MVLPSGLDFLGQFGSFCRFWDGFGGGVVFGGWCLWDGH
jgi:hypothetical protein